MNQSFKIRGEESLYWFQSICYWYRLLLVVPAQGRILCNLFASLKKGMRIIKCTFRWEHVKMCPHTAESLEGTGCTSQHWPLQQLASGLQKACVQVGLLLQYSSTVAEPCTPAAVTTVCNSFFVSLSFLLSISLIKKIIKNILCGVCIGLDALGEAW